MHPNLHRYRLDPVAQRRNAPADGGLFRRWMLAVTRQWQRRKMIAALDALDDRLLEDIGIFRGDIRRLVDGFDDRELGMVPLAPATTPVEPECEVFQKAA